MDFDDLDDLEEAAGVAPPASKPEKPVYVPTDYLPPMPRNFRLPGLDAIPERIREAYPKDPDRKICIRAIVLYGAADTWMSWAQTCITAPDFLEMVVYEWPSHGSREEEDNPSNLEKLANDAFRALKPILEQHMPGGRVENAPFAFVCHSVGCLLGVVLSKKIKDELNLEPATVVMLDRGPPHLPMFSEYGRRRMVEDKEDFFLWYNKMVWDNFKRWPGEKGDKILQGWWEDVKHANDYREVGFYKFDCPLLVIRAMKNDFLNLIAKAPDASAEVVEAQKKRDELMISPEGDAKDFGFEQFEDWKLWADDLTIEDVDVDHNGAPHHKRSRELIFAALDKVAPRPEKK